MSFFNRFFKARNPTRDWPQAASRLPTVSLQPFSIGAIKIGSTLNDLQTLGQPEKFVQGKIVSQLIYEQLPLQIELESELVTEIRMPIGYGTSNSARDGAKVGELNLDGGGRWNQHTTRQETRRMLGTPDKESNDEDESQDSYDFGEIVMNIEFNGEGKLAYLEVFVND